VTLDRAKKREESRGFTRPKSFGPAAFSVLTTTTDTHYLTMKFSLALTLAFAATAAAAVPSLTPENYDELTDGKTVFIKFFAPWVSCEFLLLF
jgi:hypothetical protein